MNSLDDLIGSTWLDPQHDEWTLQQVDHAQQMVQLTNATGAKTILQIQTFFNDFVFVGLVTTEVATEVACKQ